MVLIALILVGVFYPVLKVIVRRRWERAHPIPAAAAPSAGHKRSLNFDWRTAFTVLIALTLIAALWEARNFDFRARLFPWIFGFPLLVLVAIQLAVDLSKSRDARGTIGPAISSQAVNRRTLQMSGWLLMFFLGIWLFGFAIGGALATFIQLKLGSKEKWPIAIILTALAWVLIYGVFDRMLHVAFPAGVLSAWL
jgi:hypothetical protein